MKSDGFSAVLAALGGKEGTIRVPNAAFEGKLMFDGPEHVMEKFDAHHIGRAGGMLERRIVEPNYTRAAMALDIVEDLFASTTLQPKYTQVVIIGDNPRILEEKVRSSHAVKQYLEHRGAHNVLDLQVVMGCPGGLMADDIANQFIRAGMFENVISGGIDLLTNGAITYDASGLKFRPNQPTGFDFRDKDCLLYGDAGGLAYWIGVPDGVYENSGMSLAIKHVKYTVNLDGNLSTIVAEAIGKLGLTQQEFRETGMIVVEHSTGEHGQVIPPVSTIAQYKAAKDQGLVEKFDIKGEQRERYNKYSSFAFDIIADENVGYRSQLVTEAFLTTNAVNSAITVSVTPKGYVEAIYKNRMRGAILPSATIGNLATLRRTDGFHADMIASHPSFDPEVADFFFHIAGTRVYEEVVSTVPEMVNSITSQIQRSPKDIRFYNSHQMNQKIIESFMYRIIKDNHDNSSEVLGLCHEYMQNRVPINVDTNGNTSSGSNSFLKHQLLKGLLRERDMTYVTKKLAGYLTNKLGQNTNTYHVQNKNFAWQPGNLLLDLSAGASMNWMMHITKLTSHLMENANPVYKHKYNVK